MKLSHTIFSLKNGMEVLLLKRPEKYTVGFSLLLKAGSIYEKKSISGVSHFFEHLFFTGTKKFPTEELLRKHHQEIGLSANAKTDYDHVEVYGTLPKSELENSFQNVKEIVFSSLLTQEALEKERGVLLEEERLRQDNKYVKLWNLGMRTRFKKESPLQLPIEGVPESIEAITRSDLLHYYKMHCIPSNTKLIIGGNFKLPAFRKKIEAVFSDLPKQPKIPELKFADHLKKTKEIVASDYPYTQVYFFISFPLFAKDDLLTSWEYGFLMDLLYEELNKKLRIEKGLVYSLNVFGTRPVKDVKLKIIESACDPKNLEEVLKIIFDAIKKMKEGILDIETFERIRKTGNKLLPMNFDNLGGVMNWCIDTFFYKDIIHLPEEVIEARNAVTVAAMQKRAKTLFDFNLMHVVTLGSVLQNQLEQIVQKIDLS